MQFFAKLRDVRRAWLAAVESIQLTVCNSLWSFDITRDVMEETGVATGQVEVK